MGLLKKIALVILTLVLLWAGGLIFFITKINKDIPPTTDQVDAIIVLTGGQNRINTGLAFFTENISGQLFITGVHPDTKLEDIKEKWTGKRLPACCITLGHEATTTAQNAQETEKWLAGKNYSTIILITSHYHMPRALVEFSTIIPLSQITPYAVRQPNFSLLNQAHARLILSEYHKTTFRWLQIKTGIEITQ